MLAPHLKGDSLAFIRLKTFLNESYTEKKVHIVCPIYFCTSLAVFEVTKQI
jgi:hypothetical protein